MAQRAKGSSDISTPPPATAVPPPVHTPSSQSHDFTLQYVMDIQRSVGSLETAVESLTKSSDKHGAKLEKLNETVLTAKGILTAIAWIGGVAGAVGLALLGAIFKALADHFSKR